MPFTLSHAAAVLPLVRRDGTGRGPLLPSAMIAGSFAPDLTYFAASVLPGAMEFGTFTHSWPGVLTADAAITALLVAAWLLLREPVIALLPHTWQGRALGLLRGRTWHQRPRGPLLLWAYLSAVLGAATHTVWDAFTHHDRWGSELLPALDDNIAGQPLFWYLQYGGSALALLAVTCFTTSALRRTKAAPTDTLPHLTHRARLGALALIGTCVLLGAAHRTARWLDHWGGMPGKPWEIIPTLCFGAGAGLVPGLLLYATAVRVRPDRTGPDATGRTDPHTADQQDPHPAEPTRPTPH
ncbi:DUF4184 family protein [Streptomyces sp. TRM66268-LWL]|uniref:DUF4184 family protein n=1 Tax=Streptomyces polyasparticus TaxID=2767826 RepID=A0ABR7SA98_9ACTN|nr:DUF4184 family protein [Streptomyces polyasparticus]MBC9712069.1 DUF4184 family protein [Streptomyces polyasparticus]